LGGEGVPTACQGAAVGGDAGPAVLVGKAWVNAVQMIGRGDGRNEAVFRRSTSSREISAIDAT